MFLLFLNLILSPEISGYWQHRSVFSADKINFSQRPEFVLKAHTNDDRMSWHSEFRYRYEWEDKLGQDPELDVRELYAQISLTENLRMKVGQRIVIWGIFDEFSANDYLNSENLRYFLTDRRADRKKSLPMLEINWLFSEGSQEISFYLLPWFRSSELPPPTSAWAPLGMPYPYSKAEREFAAENNQYAFRYLSYSDAGDFGVYLFHGFDAQGAFDVLETGQIKVHYERYTGGGFSLSVPVSDHIFKGELSIRSSSARETDLLQLRKSPELRSNMGWETFALTPFWFEIDLFYTRYLQKDEHSLRAPWTAIILLQTRRNWFQEDLGAELRYAFDFQNPGHFFNAEFYYRWISSFKMTVGAYLFAGEKEGIFGQYRQNDQIYFIGQLSF